MIDFTHNPRGCARSTGVTAVCLDGVYLEHRVVLFEMMVEGQAKYEWAVRVIAPNGAQWWSCWGCTEDEARDAFRLENEQAREHFDRIKESAR